MKIMVGTKVRTDDGEEWKIDRRIYEGLFGEVFHATRIKPGPAEAVVKVPAEHIQDDPVWSKKFAREGRILANLSHPNVVRIISVWSLSAGQTALLQEYVRNAQTISDHFKDPNIDRVGIMLQALYGLRAIHGTDDRGVVHRDIAPQNVLVDPATGGVKIIDFGLARENPRVTKMLTVPGAWFGTPGCMSKEQIADAASADNRSDLFSLGKTFAAALQHRRPDHVEMDRLPRPWGTICRTLAEYEREDRPADADAAIELVINTTTHESLTVNDLRPHLAEVDAYGVEPEGWAAFCNTYFANRIRRDLLGIGDIRAASLMSAGAFKDDAFDADALFDATESGAIAAFFASGKSSFDGVDPYGQYLFRTYGPLSESNKVRCYRRLVRTAIDYHRYELMGYVRTLYGGEANRLLTDKLLQVLVAEDPENIIQGRGVIPFKRKSA
jgi:serine/threonine protein kinase